MPRITALHILRSTIETVSAPASSSFRGSLPHPTQPLCTLRVRRHRRLTQHSLPGGSLGLTWAGLAPADRASFAWRLPLFDHLVGDREHIRPHFNTGARAVPGLMAKLNSVDCSTGSSAGLAPFRTLVRYSASPVCVARSEPQPPQTPRSHVLQQISVIAGKRVCAIAPSENRMLKPALPQCGLIVNIEFVSSGIAALRTNGDGNRPKARWRGAITSEPILGGLHHQYYRV
jgi:hypothetical protein